jgi:aerobic carbon-monoxide dehydrogenase medium subunit
MTASQPSLDVRIVTVDSHPAASLPGRARMQVPAHVDYERAANVEHAVALLVRYGPEARILAGGHSLIPMMKLRLAQPDILIDINGITSLRYLRVTGGDLCIGALTRHADLLESAQVGEHFAILQDAERVIADPIVRNWGTVGGSLCQADPSEDLSAAFAALKGTMVIRGPDGTRTVSARDFHTGPYQTVVGPAELLTEIRVPIRRGSGPDGSGSGSGYLKVARRAGDWPVGAAGAAVWLADGVVAGAGLGLTALGAPHFTAPAAEDYLLGKPPSEEHLVTAGDLAAGQCRPVTDQRGPADYKLHLAGELTTRVLRLAVARARAGASQAEPPVTARPTA